MRRAIEVGIAVLLFCAGCALFYYYSSPEAFALPALVLFLRRAAWKIAYRFFWVFLILPFVPDMWRHKGEKLKRQAYLFARLFARMGRRVWHVSPRPVRFVFSILGALLSGIVAFVCIVLVPVRIQHIPFVGAWLREAGIPYLMRTAAAKQVELYLPEVWKTMPGRVRKVIDCVYRRIWWRTARYAVRTRQVLGRRALAVRHERMEQRSRTSRYF